MTARLFFLISALAFALTARAASTISFKDITSTNAVKTNDLLLVDSDLGGGNYATRTAVLTLALDKLTRKQATNALAASGSLTDVLLGNGNWGVLAFDNLTNSAAAPNDTTKFWNGKGLWSTPLSGGNVTNSGASVAGMFPTYTDTSGTQVTPTNALPNGVTLNGQSIETQLTNKVSKTLTTLQTMSGPLALTDLLSGGYSVTRATLTHAGTVTLDAGITNRYASITLTGSVTLATANLSAGKWYNVLITTTSTNDTPTFPAWKWPTGGAPSTLTANSIGSLWLFPTSTTDATTLATYMEFQ